MRMPALVVAVTLLSSPGTCKAFFSDVPRSHWAHDAIRADIDAGIIDCCWDGKFFGQRLLNRYQVAITMAKVLDALTPHPPLRATPDPAADPRLGSLRLRIAQLEGELAELSLQVRVLKAARRPQLPGADPRRRSSFFAPSHRGHSAPSRSAPH